MSGQSWLVDASRIATKIKYAYDPKKIEWKTNPSKSCPKCQHVIYNSDNPHPWSGLPRGVKFDPNDQEIILHLLAKVDKASFKPHPFIDEFIPTVNEEDGICYTHPQNLPGVKQDGSVSHFFHKAIKAYSNGTRKRRRIHGDDSGDVRWHKSGRTKPVFADGLQRGCKKILVLYVNSEKTNWVMHQYHLGTEEKEGEYVLSKIFYQQQPQAKLLGTQEDTMTAKVTPNSATHPEPHAAMISSYNNSLQDPIVERQNENEGIMEDVLEASPNNSNENEGIREDVLETCPCNSNDQDQNNVENIINADQVGNEVGRELLWEKVSECLLNSQQLHEGVYFCDDFLQNQSPNREPLLDVDYTHLGLESFMRELEECLNLPEDFVVDLASDDLPFDPPIEDFMTVDLASDDLLFDQPIEDFMTVDLANNDLPQAPDLTNEDFMNVDLASDNLPSDLAAIDVGTPSEFSLSQLVFESQDSYIAWGGSFEGGRVIDD